MNFADLCPLCRFIKVYDSSGAPCQLGRMSTGPMLLHIFVLAILSLSTVTTNTINKTLYVDLNVSRKFSTLDYEEKDMNPDVQHRLVVYG